MAIECNTSSSGYDSTPIKGSSNSILWVGGDIICNGEKLICNNTRLTDLQLVFAEKICELLGVTDMSDVVSFTCDGELGDAFRSLMVSSSNNPTILQLVNLILQQQCITNNNITNIVDGTTQIQNFDPTFTVNYVCCDDSCITGSSLKLSEHIQKIILCLCEVKGDLDSLTSRVVELENNTFQEQINTINNTIAQLTTVRIPAIETAVENCCG